MHIEIDRTKNGRTRLTLTHSPVFIVWICSFCRRPSLPRNLPPHARRRRTRGAAGQASPWVAPSWDSDAWAAAASSRRVVSNSSIPACRLGLLHRGSRLAALGLGLASAGSEARRFLAGGLGVAGRGAQDWFHVGSHCAVSRNFAKLPVGVVCVADVQFKGRGFQAAQLGFVVVGKVVYFTSSNSVAGFQALEEQLL
ncbi:hypothetical protein BDA96_06G255900 [Sorghum bicolor]|uniref:Uncharacterized protein n=1 Tax=Sorghum bicolor TaxID=4558 RepID=A0A921QU37_SORBI|nr:hypothetical protein BDA96_06G255900 [Sorghum bicolor]